MICEKPTTSDWLGRSMINFGYVWNYEALSYIRFGGADYIALPYSKVTFISNSVNLTNLGYPPIVRGGGDLLNNRREDGAIKIEGGTHTITVSQVIDHIARGNIEIGSTFTIHQSPDESRIIIRDGLGRVVFPCWLVDYKEPVDGVEDKNSIDDVFKQIFKNVQIKNNSYPLPVSCKPCNEYKLIKSHMCNNMIPIQTYIKEDNVYFAQTEWISVNLPYSIPNIVLSKDLKKTFIKQQYSAIEFETIGVNKNNTMYFSETDSPTRFTLYCQSDIIIRDLLQGFTYPPNYFHIDGKLFHPNGTQVFPCI